MGEAAPRTSRPSGQSIRRALAPTALPLRYRAVAFANVPRILIRDAMIAGEAA